MSFAERFRAALVELREEHVQDFPELFTAEHVGKAIGLPASIAADLLMAGEIPGGRVLSDGEWVCDLVQTGLMPPLARKAPERPRRGLDPEIVYFLQREGAPTDPIKIGTSTVLRLGRRIGSLQTGHAYKLVVLATMPGDWEVEHRLHETFSHARLAGEWFSACESLLAFIDGLRKDGGG